MTRRLVCCALALTLCAAAEAATINTTITVNATAALSGLSLVVTGTAAFTGGIPNGTLSATLSLGNISGANIVAPITITFPDGSTLTGNVTLPAALLLGTSTSGSGSGTITGGTGAYAGATGSFPSLSGSGSATATGLAFTFSGAGTITTGGSSGSGTPAPVILAVQNNYSYTLPGLPNYGIAPGSLFIVKGTNLNNQPLSSLQSSAAPGLPTTLNSASVSVTVNGTTTHPAFYYTSPSQLGMVLPSTTPVGTGTITVTSNGQISAAAPIQVVQSALGLDTLLGTGSGAAVATDNNGNVFTVTNSAQPGQPIVLWGSGVGADTNNNDTTYPLTQDNLTGIPLTVYIGGIQANVLYRGRSQYPGVDQVDVTIPSTVATGCNVSVMAVSGNIVSNVVTLPIMPNGGVCSDSNSPVTGTAFQSLSGKSSVNIGILALLQQTSVSGSGASATTTVTNTGAGIFENWSGTQFVSSGQVNSPSLGSCFVSTTTVASAGSFLTGFLTGSGLDAGALSVTGPAGTQSLAPVVSLPGFYGGQLPSGFLSSSGGLYTFKGTGGANVAAFTSALNYPASIVWTNMSSISTITRNQGVNIKWTGGASGTYVLITGSSSASLAGQGITVSFTCAAPTSAGTFTVPAGILALPAGSGSLMVQNTINPQSFTAAGLDVGYAFAGSQFSISPTYN